MAPKHSSRGINGGKPFPEFPLHKHGSGYWARKIAGKRYYFGKVADDPEGVEALERHNKEYPYRKAGVPVPDSYDGLTVHSLCNQFLNWKLDQVEAGEITQRWYDDIYQVCGFILKRFGESRPVDSLTPTDFQKIRTAIVQKHAPSIARNWISRIKSVFKYGWDCRLITRPVDYGKAFEPPTRAQVRKHRAMKGKQLWTPEQVHSLLEHANPVMTAMIWLGINAGVNPSDILNMPITAIDFDSGWMDYPRAKTFIQRRVKLWPETIAAVKKWLQVRPSTTGELSKLMFVTKQRNQWHARGIAHELEKVCTKAGLEAGTFIWFRKTVQTIGENSGDIVAVRAVMGHVDDSMSDHYRETIDDKRLERVTDTIRKWLGSAPRKGKRGAK